MRQTRVMMGMPITVEIADPTARQAAIDRVFGYFDYVDRKFSTYKPDSEISRINAGELQSVGYSEDMRQVFRLSEETRRLTDGYFDIRRPDGRYDPSGLVKGLAILNAAKMLATGAPYFDQHIAVEHEVVINTALPEGHVKVGSPEVVAPAASNPK